MAEPIRQPRLTMAEMTRVQILRIAAAAVAHPNTVTKFLNGESIRGDVALRIRRAYEDEKAKTGAR